MDHISAELAKAVQAAMDGKGVSKRQMAADTGIPFTTLDRKLRGLGNSDFTFPELHLIADRLECRVSDIIPEGLLT